VPQGEIYGVIAVVAIVAIVAVVFILNMVGKSKAEKR